MFHNHKLIPQRLNNKNTSNFTLEEKKDSYFYFTYYRYFEE